MYLLEVYQRRATCRFRESLRKARLAQIIELNVTDEHLALDRAFFEGAVGHPLQVLFRIDAQ